MASGLSMFAVRQRTGAATAFAATLAIGASAHAAHNCTVTANDLAFGLYSTLNSTNVDSTADITVDCSGSDNVRVRATTDISTGSSGTYSTRTMLSGANTLNYNIYKNSGHTNIWGDGTGASANSPKIRCNLRGPPTTCTNSRTMYGRIPVSQVVPAGSYADTLIVTITY